MKQEANFCIFNQPEKKINVFCGVVYPDITDISWPEKQTVNVIDLFIIYTASSGYKLSHAVSKNTVKTIQVEKYQIAGPILQIHTILVACEKLTEPSELLGFPVMSRAGAHTCSSGGAFWWWKDKSDFSEIKMMF